jgi:hypothetical protein
VDVKISRKFDYDDFDIEGDIEAAVALADLVRNAAYGTVLISADPLDRRQLSV